MRQSILGSTVFLLTGRCASNPQVRYREGQKIPSTGILGKRTFSLKKYKIVFLVFFSRRHRMLSLFS